MTTVAPLVSIIIPAYNAEKYIAEAILSVLDQTFQEWELLVIDDGSTDSTATIVESFIDYRISLIQQENRGVSVARNAGLNIAKGKYLTFLDADDLLPPNSLISRVEYLESHPEIDLVDGKIIVKDENMCKVIRTYEPYYIGKLLPRLLMLDDKVFFGVCYMFKRKLLENIRFKQNMSHAEDILFYMELADVNSVSYGFVDETIYLYKSGHSSAMQNLEALENGYKRLIVDVNHLNNVTSLYQFFLRIKITKIMILSWISEKKYLRALSSIRLLWL